MSDSSLVETDQPLSLRSAWLAYGACMSTLFASVALASRLVAFNNLWAVLALITYAACGGFLNRNVLFSLVEFNPLYHTLDHELRTKLAFFLVWPLRYLGLLVTLTLRRII